MPVRPGRFRLHRATANLDWFVERRRRWTNDSMWLAAQIEPTFDIDPLDTDEDRARWRAWTMKALHPARRLTVDEWLAGCAWAHGQLEWSRKVTA